MSKIFSLDSSVITYLFSELLINEMKSSLEAGGSIDSILPHK